MVGWVRSKREASAPRNVVLADLRGSVLAALGSTLEILGVEGRPGRARAWLRAWLCWEGDLAFIGGDLRPEAGLLFCFSYRIDLGILNAERKVLVGKGKVNIQKGVLPGRLAEEVEEVRSLA